MSLNFSALSSKATLVKLTQKSLGTTKRESQLTADLQVAQSDTGLVVLSKLFTDKHNPVNEALKMTSELYQYHRKRTLPYEDGGRRMLPNDQYMTYAKGISDRREALKEWGKTHLVNYDSYVLSDITHRAKNGKARVNTDDYPSANRLAQTLNPIVLFDPIPDVNAFSPLVELSKEDLDNFEAAQNERFAIAQQDAVNRVIEPLTKLVKKLEVYAGSSEERFHASLVSNVIEGANLAKDLSLEGSSQYFDALTEIAHLANTTSVDALRENSRYRETTKTNMEEAMEKLALFAPKV